MQRPVRSITTELLLIDISRKKLNVATATFNILLKLYGVLDYKRSVLVTELRQLCRYSKMSGICMRLNTYLSTESYKAQITKEESYSSIYGKED